jgi:hypothetical protein
MPASRALQEAKPFFARVETGSTSRRRRREAVSWHNARDMSLPRVSSRARFALALVAALGSACARPYAGPKTLAAIGTGLLAAGGSTWVVGDREGRGSLGVAGMATAALGAAAVLAAGGWLAVGVACTEDQDCPRTDECREIPTQPGGFPYRQCMARPGP